MNELIKKLQERKNNLDQSEFCDFLKNTDIPAKQRLSFAPSMFYFVLGFRDMLTALTDESDTSEYQKIVNVHCVEDSTHWYWYLRDLKHLSKLNYVQYDGLVEEAHIIWAPENWHIRNVVYEVMHSCKSVKSPFLRLVIIQVLEATFGAFNGGMSQLIGELDLYDDLNYYGKQHMCAEEDHSFDDWLDLDPNDTKWKDLKISNEEREQGLAIIDRLFDAFENMFDTWLKNVKPESRKMIA